MTGGYMGSLKRKDFEEGCMDYFNGDVDVVTSAKKLRLDPGMPGILEDTQGFGIACDEMPLEIPQLLQSPELPVVDTELPPIIPNEEKALVLYKPVNPPMFPGGPAAGSPDLPIKFNANCLANNKAWQFCGMGNMANLFHVSRSSHSLLNPGMSTISDINPVDNSLAMIPWVPSQFPRSTQEVVADQKSGCDNGNENNDLIPMEDENMVSMEEDPVQQSPANVIGSDGVQWQHCMTTSQPPQNTPVMWSY